MSAIPRTERFVDATIWVLRGLFARKFRLHPFHSSTKGFPAVRLFFGLGVRGGRLQVVTLRLGARSPFRVEAPGWVFSFLPGPCWGLSHLAGSF